MFGIRLTKSKYLYELASLRQKVSAFEKAELERKQTEKIANDIENIFSAIMERTPIYVFIKDETTRAVRLSKNYEKMLGKPLDELLNRTVEDLFPPDLAKSMIADDMRILNNEICEKIEEELNGRIYSTIKFPIVTDSQNRYLAGFTIDITEQKRTAAELKDTIHRLRKTLGAVVQAMVTVVETRDPYTAGHQRRVSDLSRAIAAEMNLDKNQIDGIRIGSSIHDIGKISIPAEILTKPTKLTPMEFAIIKSHPATGHDILKDIEFPWPIARMILEHHEHMDGSGYPNGLTGGNILMESRILTVADVVEAMASHRPYRPSLGIDEALAEITKNSGVLYDPEVVSVCLRLFRQKNYQITR